MREILASRFCVLWRWRKSTAEFKKQMAEIQANKRGKERCHLDGRPEWMIHSPGRTRHVWRRLVPHLFVMPILSIFNDLSWNGSRFSPQGEDKCWLNDEFVDLSNIVISAKKKWRRRKTSYTKILSQKFVFVVKGGARNEINIDTLNSHSVHNTGEKKRGLHRDSYSIENVMESHTSWR